MKNKNESEKLRAKKSKRNTCPMVVSFNTVCILKYLVVPIRLVLGIARS